MGILGWIVFGALAGWVASIIVGNRSQQGCLGNVIVGVIGAFLGGWIMRLIQGEGMSMEAFGWDWYSFGVAVLGAVVLLFLTGARGRSKKRS